MMISSMEHITKNLGETQELAKEWLASLGALGAKSGGATLAGLVGDLGSGKTSFVQGVARSFGITESVTSPTFILERIYQIPKPDNQNLTTDNFSQLIHIDAYRLEGASELGHLGWDELAKDPGNLILVEWPERIFSPLPQDMQILKFEFIDENTRKISF